MNRQERRAQDRLGRKVRKQLATPIPTRYTRASGAEAAATLAAATEGTITPSFVSAFVSDDPALPVGLLFGFDDTDDLSDLGGLLAAAANNPFAAMQTAEGDYTGGWRTIADENGPLAAVYRFETANEHVQVLVDIHDPSTRAQITPIVDSGGIVWCTRRSQLDPLLVRDDLTVEHFYGVAAAFPSLAAPTLAGILRDLST